VSRASTFPVASFVSRARIAQDASPYQHHPLAHRELHTSTPLATCRQGPPVPTPYRARTTTYGCASCDSGHPIQCLKHENTCNTKKNLLQRTSESDETLGTSACNICVKQMQHPDMHLKWMKHFKQMLATSMCKHM
jgi:hypothetical protein